MAKSRIKARGATRGRLKPKMLGKGCSTLNKRVRARSQRRVHVKTPGIIDKDTHIIA
ncbi:MAG TPA: hypothetical protein PKE00_08640 [Planctomycetota bacterium]|mgnify:CR=1 FL=1|nr:hypothetical protein [Planctomycetota bacterium]